MTLGPTTYAGRHRWGPASDQWRIRLYVDSLAYARRNGRRPAVPVLS